MDPLKGRKPCKLLGFLGKLEVAWNLKYIPTVVKGICVFKIIQKDDHGYSVVSR